MPSDRETVLDRVRKLLALSSSPNVHEAALAAAHAQKLITKHRLEAWLHDERSAEADPIEDARDEPLETSRRPRKWKRALAATLARDNGCVAYVLAQGSTKSIVLIGRSADRDAVRVLWDGLVRRVEWLSATHGEGQNKKWHEAFRIGVVEAIAERLRSDAQPDDSELDDGALVLVESRMRAHLDRLDAFVQRRLGASKSRRLTVDASAFAAGQQAGRRMPLS